jgi:putative sterol carrier protein
VLTGFDPVRKKGENFHMTVAESFERVLGLFNPAAASNMNKTFQWNITGDEAGKYALKIVNGKCELVTGGVEKPDVTFTISDKDWLAVAEGKMDAMNAFASGKLKFAGDIMLAMKTQQLFPIKR